MPIPYRPARSTSERVRRLRPGFDRLECRRLLARSIQIQSAILVDSAGQAITAPAVGEQVFVRADWTTSGLTPSDSYVVGYTIDGVTIDAPAFTGQRGNNLSYNWGLGGWFASPGTHDVTVTVDPTGQVSGADESQASTSFAFAPQAPTSLPAKFLDPMGTLNTNWTIVNYLDVNPASASFNDYKGGPYTYDGHSGMDLTLANFPRMDAGYPVFAAASGTVSQVSDGNFDRDAASSSNPANFVVIDDGNAWQTIYYHFMSGSIAVKVGQAVTAGQMIGLVGSSGDSTDAHLHFEVQHDGDLVETNYAPSSYWVTPFTYEDNVPPYVMDAGITDSSPFADMKERPVDMSTFPTSSTSTSVWYWYRLSHLGPTDTALIHWYKPDGTLATTYTYNPTGTLRYDGEGWNLGYSAWSTAIGTWHVSVSVDGVEMGREAFTVTAGAGVPAMRLTQGTAGGTYIVDGRTTPLDFGSVARTASPPTLGFTVQNVGLAPLTLGVPTLPTGFALVGAFPSTIATGATATFTVQMNTAEVGPRFGQITFPTNVPAVPTFGFNVSGTVTGSAPAGAPTVAFGGPAAVFDPRVGPVAIDPTMTLTDGSPGGLNGGALTVTLVSGGTAADHLAIGNQGVGAGQVGLSGASVLYGGTAVGTVAGGDGLAPLVVTFNASASVAAAQAVAQDVVFRSDLPLTTAPRYVRVWLSDSAGLTSNRAVKTVELDPGLPGVALTAASTNVIQGGSILIGVALASQPAGNVTITLAPGPNLTPGTTTLTFTPANWLTPQSVSVSALAGSGGTTSTIGATATAGAPEYAGISAAPLVVTITKATTLVLTTAPTSPVPAGSPFVLVVKAEDGSGNIDPTFTGLITATLSGGPAGATLGGATATAVAGVATFPALTLNEVGAGSMLTVSGGGLAVATAGPITVGPAITTTGLSASPTSSVFGQSVTLKAIVAAVGPVAAPSGTVIFKDGSTVLGQVSLSTVGGVTSASLAVKSLGVGGHAITATYSGDGNDLGGISAALPLAVAKDATTTLAGPSTFAPVRGQSMSVFAVVAAATPGSGTPTGTVTFKSGSTVLATEPLVTAGGQTSATLPLSSMSLGTTTITAVYSGDGSFLPGSAPTTFTTGPDATSVNVGPSDFAPVRGELLAINAIVSANAPGAGAPTGTVTFKVGSTVLATEPVVAAGALRYAQLPALPYGLGSYAITAVYNGDAGDAPSTSTTRFTVGPDATTTVAGPSIFAPKAGQSLSLNAIVSVNAPGAGTPTGTVTFNYAGKFFATATLKTVNGLTYATLPLAPLGAGTYTFTAVYNGDAGDKTSLGSTTFTVAPAAARGAAPALAPAPGPAAMAIVPAGPASAFVPAPAPAALRKNMGQGWIRPTWLVGIGGA